MGLDYNFTSATITYGRYDDLVSEYQVSPLSDSFYLWEWPQGNHFVADDYSTAWNEPVSTARAEMIAIAVDCGSGSHNISIILYDQYKRQIASYAPTGVIAALMVNGRFGEKNLFLELTQSGKYYVDIVVDGAVARITFFVYIGTVDKYLALSPLGNDNYDGNSWSAAKATWDAAQTSLTSGHYINVLEGDYSTQSGFVFTKSQDIVCTKKTWGGFPPNINEATSVISDSTLETYCELMHPVEFDGTIDKWAVWCATGGSPQVKLKIYRGGNPGMATHSTSTLVYNGTLQNVTINGWNTYTLSSPVTVERGDILAVYCNTLNRLGRFYGNGSCGSTNGIGDAGNHDWNDWGIQGSTIMLGAWNSGQIVVLCPKY